MITIQGRLSGAYAQSGNRKRGDGKNRDGRNLTASSGRGRSSRPEVLDLARRQLEACAELAVLEEDIRVPEAGCVEVLPLPLLGEDALNALDESDLLEDPDLPVAGGDRDAVPLADFLGTDFPLVRGEKDLGAVFVGQKLGGLEGR